MKASKPSFAVRLSDSDWARFEAWRQERADSNGP